MDSGTPNPGSQPGTTHSSTPTVTTSAATRTGPTTRGSHSTMSTPTNGSAAVADCPRVTIMRTTSTICTTITVMPSALPVGHGSHARRPRGPPPAIRERSQPGRICSIHAPR